MIAGRDDHVSARRTTVAILAVPPKKPPLATPGESEHLSEDG